PLPPLAEQKRIVAEIEKQFAKTKQLKEHIIANQQATEQLLKALLHQAFQPRLPGEVEEMEEVNTEYPTHRQSHRFTELQSAFKSIFRFVPWSRCVYFFGHTFG